MKKTVLTIATLFVFLFVMGQGNNTGMGGNDGNYQSLAERVLNLEKKTDAFNVYFNYASSFQENDDGNKWSSSFKNKQARLEIKGNITDKLSYRFRQRLNRNNTAQSEDNFSKAIDILMVGYQFTDKLGVQGGKMCQNWGGFEFDENPMYIYQYSDMIDNMDNFMAGVNVSIKPVSSQEFDVNITDAYNNKFANEYGDDAKVLEKDGTSKLLKASNQPLTYIFLWNGNFLQGKLQTRWSWGSQTQAEGKSSQMLILGQKLNLSKFQWYFDYMGAFDGLDRLRIVSNEGKSYLTQKGADYFGDIHYNSFITKMNWQFAPQFNLMLKGAYETASATKDETFKNYRKSVLYAASFEYYPVKSQDFRVFLAYIGRNFNYSDKVTQYGLNDYKTNRIELGFMYRIKAF